MNHVLAVSLCWTDASCLSEPSLFSYYYSLMPEYRQEQIMRFRFEKDRNLSLAAGVLLYRAMKEAGIPDAPVAFGAYGKPYLPDFPDFRFSLSHSGTLALFSLSPCETGCDLEVVRAENITVARRFFSASEQALLSDEPDAYARAELFCRIWTLKESFLKASGYGLTVPLERISLSFSSGAPLVEQDLIPGPFRFLEPDIRSKYRCACCVQTDRDLVPSLRFSALER